MPCGCSNNEHLRTRAAVCASCPHLSGGHCTKSGSSVILKLNGEACPIGRYRGGLVRWLGVWWRGYPWPLRAWAWAEARDERWFNLPGCGCIDRLKGWAEWVTFARRATPQSS